MLLRLLADGRPISPRETSPPVSSRVATALQLVKTSEPPCDGASNTTSAASAAAAGGASRAWKASDDDAVYSTPFDLAARVCDIVIDGVQVSRSRACSVGARDVHLCPYFTAAFH